MIEYSRMLNNFYNPGSRYRGKPFWGWNGKLEQKELRRQIKIMRGMGLGGFYMHSRAGLATPYLSNEWFKCISACIKEAEKSGMEAWIYDEDRWPSGAAGGFVTKNRKYRMQHLRCEMRKPGVPFVWQDNYIGVFTAQIENHTAYNVKKIRRDEVPALEPNEDLLVFICERHPDNNWYNGQAYLDTMNPEAVGEFIRITHEEYRKRCGKYFGNVVPGIFTDEPFCGFCLCDDNSESIPWTELLSVKFREWYGYDVRDFLPELFFDIAGQDIYKARYHYHDCKTRLFIGAFMRQIWEWCDREGLQFTGHLQGEDNMRLQTSRFGSSMRCYEYMHMPGVDYLTEWRRTFGMFKQLSSSSRQFGKRRRLAETYGCTGWDFSFQGQKAVGDMQAVFGVNERCQHLYWYTMAGEAKRDYPASIGHQSPWWKVYHVVEDYFARINYILSNGEEIRDLLVIYPNESMWLVVRKGWFGGKDAEIFDRKLAGIEDELLSAHLDFDYGDEEILARKARICLNDNQPYLKVGNAVYRAVAVPPMLTMRSTTLKLLEDFHKLGGKVVFIGRENIPCRLDVEPTEKIRFFASQCPVIGAKKGEMLKVFDASCRRVNITDEKDEEIPCVYYLLRETPESFLLFICNTSYSQEQLVNSDFYRGSSISERREEFPLVKIIGMSGCRGCPELWDAETGKVYAAYASKRQDEKWEIQTSLSHFQSRLFVIPKNPVEAKPPIPIYETRERKELPDIFDIIPDEPNVLPLDLADCSIRSDCIARNEDILEIDRRIRKLLGIPQRSHNMIQPWAEIKKEKKKALPVELKYVFNVDDIPEKPLMLAVEFPERFKILVNRQTVKIKTDYFWVDKSLSLLKVPSGIILKGKNRLEMSCEYTDAHGLEIIYLLGDFCIDRQDGGNIITAPVGKLKIGDWTSQGFPFYSGSISYKTAVSIPGRLAGERIFLKIPEYEATALNVSVNGRQAGVIAWEPNELDITDYVEGRIFELEIEVISSRRNSHGPLHCIKNYKGVSPAHFGVGNNNTYSWSRKYQIVPCGIMKRPELQVRKIQKLSEGHKKRRDFHEYR